MKKSFTFCYYGPNDRPCRRVKVTGHHWENFVRNVQVDWRNLTICINESEVHKFIAANRRHARRTMRQYLSTYNKKNIPSGGSMFIPEAGSDITQTVQYTIAWSNVFEEDIFFKFNGVPVEINESADEDAIIKKYHEDLGIKYAKSTIDRWNWNKSK